jgi:hypothetical protein
MERDRRVSVEDASGAMYRWGIFFSAASPSQGDHWEYADSCDIDSLGNGACLVLHNLALRISFFLELTLHLRESPLDMST